MRIERASLLVAALLLATTATAVQLNLVSDIHLDPQYGKSDGYVCTTDSARPLGQPGCDSPPALVTSVTTDLSTRNSAYTFLAGDWQRHHYSTSGLTAAAVFELLSLSMASVTTNGAYTTPAFIGCIGNNDVVPDYHFEWNATTHPGLDERVDAMTDRLLLDAVEATSMKQCGNYQRDVGTAVVVVVLNTLLWSHSITPAVPSDVADPCGQFAFLEGALQSAKAAGKKVVIMSHIPPTPNVYAVVSRGKFSNETEDMYWKPDYQSRYYQLLASNKDTVQMQVFGHTHFFTPIAVASVGVPAFVLPAVTPLYGNNPSYMVAEVDESWAIQDMQQRYMDASGTWRDGATVKGALGLSFGFADIETMESELSAMLVNDFAWGNYLRLYEGGVGGTTEFGTKCNGFCRAVMVCSMTTSTYDTLKACVTAGTGPVIPPVNLGDSIVTTVLLLGVSLTVAALLLLSHIVPLIRSGELRFSKIEYDFAAEVLGRTPKKEKARQRAAAEARRQQRNSLSSDNALAAASSVEVRVEPPMTEGEPHYNEHSHRTSEVDPASFSETGSRYAAARRE